MFSAAKHSMRTPILFLLSLWVILISLVSSTNAYQMTFIPRLSVTEEYSDNIYLTQTDEEYDFITAISPGFSVNLTGRNAGADISYDPAYTVYDRFPENDGWRHNAGFNAWNELTRDTRVELTDSFLYTEDPISEDPDASDATTGDGTIRRDREPYYTNSAGMRLTNQLSQQSSLHISYEHSILGNESSLYEDNTSSTPSAGFTYRFERIRLNIETELSYTLAKYSGVPVDERSDDFGEYNGSLRLVKNFSGSFLEGFIQYAHTDMNYDGETENYRIYDTSTGISYSHAQYLIASLSLGYYIRDYEETENEDGLTATAGIEKIFRHGAIGLNGSYGYNETQLDAENLGFATYHEAESTARYTFSTTLSGDVRASYRKDNYEDVDPEREDESAESGIGFTYLPKRWISIRLEYTYRKVSSTERGNGFDENRALLRISLTSSRPLRTH